MTVRNCCYVVMARRRAIFYKGSMRNYKGSMRIYKGSMSLFRTLVLTNEITVFVTTRI